MAYQVERANKRDKASRKKRYGHSVSNKSIFTIVETMVNRTEKRKKKK